MPTIHYSVPYLHVIKKPVSLPGIGEQQPQRTVVMVTMTTLQLPCRRGCQKPPDGADGQRAARSQCAAEEHRGEVCACRAARAGYRHVGQGQVQAEQVVEQSVS